MSITLSPEILGTFSAIQEREPGTVFVLESRMVHVNCGVVG